MAALLLLSSSSISANFWVEGGRRKLAFFRPPSSVVTSPRTSDLERSPRANFSLQDSPVIEEGADVCKQQ